MEQKLNIAEILKDKPKNTKLYSPLFGDVYFLCVEDGIITVAHHDGIAVFFGDGRYYNYPESEPLLFPSKEMHDWSKFAWKKGDVLINPTKRINVIFVKFTNDSYTTFEGTHYLEDISSSSCPVYTYEPKLDHLRTKDYISQNKKEAEHYLQTIPVRLTNDPDTLNTEKQSEFKDGDIVCISGMGYCTYGIIKSIDNLSKKLEYYVLRDANILKFEDWLSFEDKHIQPIKETQRRILFDSLAKEGKAWDAEKKQIVDLKLKWIPKPFDKVVVRCGEADKWSIDFFSYKVSNGYICTGDAWFGYCLPYNEETAKLVGTTNNVEG